MAEYKVQFEVFEGPLDLLLYLVRKEEVDIYQVNLTRLATQFIEYVDVMRQLDLDIAGEFLVMAATLMYIKSRELLPVDQQAQAEGEDEDGDDPRWELIRKLVEYKKFKDAASQLQGLELRQERMYPRQPPEVEPEAEPVRLEASLFDLVHAVSVILKRFQDRHEARDIFEDKWSVSEKIEYLRQTITERGSFRFSELFGQATSRSEVVVTFLAMLELIRLRQLVALQHEAFGEIEIAAAPPPAAVVPAPAEVGVGTESVSVVSEAEPARADAEVGAVAAGEAVASGGEREGREAGGEAKGMGLAGGEGSVAGAGEAPATA
jgi:segregation and condensation protein A